MSHALYHLHGRVSLRLVLLLAVGLSAQTVGAIGLGGGASGWNGSPLSTSGDASVSRDASTGKITITYSASGTNAVLVSAGWSWKDGGAGASVNTSTSDYSASKSGVWEFYPGPSGIVVVTAGAAAWDGLSWVSTSGGGSVELAAGESEDLLTHYVPVNFRNNTEYPAWLLVYGPVGSESASFVHEELVEPGAAVSAMIGPLPEGEYGVSVQYTGIQKDEVLGWVTASEVTRTNEIPVGTVATESSASGEPPPAPTETPTDLPTSETNEDAPPSKEQSAPSGAVVFKTSTSNPSGGLTENTFERGIAQVINAVAKGPQTKSGSATVVTVNNSGVESRLDQANLFLDGLTTKSALANDKLDELIAQGETAAEGRETETELLEAQKEAYDNTPSTSDMQSQGNAAAASISAALPSVAIVPAQGPEGDEPDFTIDLPATMGGAEIDLNPFRSDRLGGVVAWFRGAVAWLVIVTFGVWLFGAINESVVNITVVQQAKGNAVLGGTGAQATALVAATALSAVIGTVIVGLVGWTFGDIGFSAVLSVLSSNPLQSMPGRAAWMLDKVFPVATMLTALLGRISFRFYAIQLHAASAAIIRFIVP